MSFHYWPNRRLCYCRKTLSRLKSWLLQSRTRWHSVNPFAMFPFRNVNLVFPFGWPETPWENGGADNRLNVKQDMRNAYQMNVKMSTYLSPNWPTKNVPITSPIRFSANVFVWYISFEHTQSSWDTIVLSYQVLSYSRTSQSTRTDPKNMAGLAEWKWKYVWGRTNFLPKSVRSQTNKQTNHMQNVPINIVVAGEWVVWNWVRYATTTRIACIAIPSTE